MGVSGSCCRVSDVQAGRGEPVIEVTAAAHPNLAFVKYWGRRDDLLNLPLNGSISVNLSGATTTTSVDFDDGLAADEVLLNGEPADSTTVGRVTAHLDRVRTMAQVVSRARVVSRNDFPADVGFASSASAFAALSLAATRAAGITLCERDLSVLARKGSGSACRSIPDGFVEWLPGRDDVSSYARSLAPCGHWDLRIVTVAPETAPKLVSSLDGHRAAHTSPFYAARLAEIEHVLGRVRASLVTRDFQSLALAVEREALSLHAVAATSVVAHVPWLSGILYIEPATVRLMLAVQHWRRDGLAVAFTLDAGPSIHLLCEAGSLGDVRAAVTQEMDGIPHQLYVSHPGRGAWLKNETGEAEAPPDQTCSQ